MVFVGNRRAKQGHNAIAQHLIHRALEAVHSVHHELHGRIEELLGGFGIEAADEFGRVFEVGKQHRDLLAFAFQGGAGGEDLVGQMGWGIGQWRRVRRTGLHHRRIRRLAGAGPPRHQSRPGLVVLIHGHALRRNDLVFQVLQAGIVELELPLEGVIGHASPLAQQVQHLIQHGIKVHHACPAWATWESSRRVRSSDAARSSPAGTGDTSTSVAPRANNPAMASATRASSPHRATASIIASLQLPCVTSSNPAARNMFW